jgi:hypothetical protein
MLEHDPGKRVPAFRRDHAGSQERTGATGDRSVQMVCGMMQARNSRRLAAAALAATGLALAAGQAQADAIKNPIAVFAALDKVTGRISHLEIPINKTVAFGALKVTPRVCDTRPPTEAPNTSSFVEVDEVKLTGEVQRIFTGWMLAESPGLHAVEHPVFDVWLTNCKTNEAPAPSGNRANAPAPEAPAAAPAAAPAPPPPPPPAEEAQTPDEPLPWAKPPANAASRNR